MKSHPKLKKLFETYQKLLDNTYFLKGSGREVFEEILIEAKEELERMKC